MHSPGPGLWKRLQFVRQIRFWLAVVILILALGLLAISVSPALHWQQVLPLPPVVLPSPTPLSLLSGWKGF